MAPWLSMTAAAAVGSVVLNQFDLVSSNAIAKLFGGLFATEVALYSMYKVLIYPFYVSPLRHLPIPPNRHWLFGHGLVILREKNSDPAKRW